VSITDLDSLRARFASHGCTAILSKKLAANDNSKNQIYLGGNFEALAPLRHGRINIEDDQPKASLDLYWLSETGGAEPAVHSQLVLYTQYPEVRLSGFLSGCMSAPSSVLSKRLAGRRLVLGLRADGRIFAWACDPGHQVAVELNALDAAGSTSSVAVFGQVTLSPGAVASPEQILLSALGDLHRRGFVKGRRLLADGSSVATSYQNAGGYTLEAEMGVAANSAKAPDFQGWELKSCTVPAFDRPQMSKRVTLITPEPTGGVYLEQGINIFMDRYGYADTRGVPDRLNFGGQFRVGTRNARTGLTLRLNGFSWSKKANRPTIDLKTGALILADDSEATAALWRFTDLLDHWNRKHAQAAYVPMVRHETDDGAEFKYGDRILLGQGTDFLLFLRALELGKVVYDPGIKLEAASSDKPKVKKRNQFRVSFRDLSCLYRRFGEHQTPP